MNRRRSGARGGLRWLPAALLPLSLLAACGSSAESEEEATYSVGFPALLSGSASFAGIPISQGAQLAVQEINESGYLGEGRTVRLDVADTKVDPAQAIALYRQYASDGYSAVLCCGLSAEAGALAPVISSSGVPAVVTSAILPDLADPPNIFRSHVLPSQDGGLYDQFVDTVVPAEGHETAVMVVNADNDAMVEDGEVWESALERNAVRVTRTISTNTADTSYTGVATEIAAADPDVVVASTIGSSTALLAKALRERGYDKRILTSYGADGRAVFEASGGGAVGVTFAAPFHAEFTENERAERFTRAYREEFDADPDMWSAQGYTAMWFIAQGLRDAGSADPRDVGAALTGIDSQDTVFGPLSYTEGQASLSAAGVLLEWTEGGVLREWDAED